ncbi:MAG: hypothetical protein JRN68_00960 [Nitrososphaerota archaeon]|nr:hypothetical protein [Nitrososphaerota archaeon]
MKILLDIGRIELKEVTQQYTDYRLKDKTGVYKPKKMKRLAWALTTENPQLLCYIIYHLGLGGSHSHTAANRVYVTSQADGERVMGVLRRLERPVKNKQAVNVRNVHN